MTKPNDCCPSAKDIATLQSLERVYGNLTNGTYSVNKGGSNIGKKVKEMKY